jgi:hypothetical protein
LTFDFAFFLPFIERSSCLRAASRRKDQPGRP